MSFGHQTGWSSACCTDTWRGRVCRVASSSWSRVRFFIPGCVCIFGSGYFCGGYIINIANAGIRSVDSLFIALSYPCYKVTYLISSLEQEASLQMVNSLVMPLNTQTRSDKLGEVKCSSAVSAFFIPETHPCLYRVIRTPSPGLEVEA